MDEIKRSYFFRADTYEYSERDKKIADLKKALEIDPNFVDALWVLGLEYNSIRLLSSTEHQRQQMLREAINVLTG